MISFQFMSINISSVNIFKEQKACHFQALIFSFCLFKFQRLTTILKILILSMKNKGAILHLTCLELHLD